MNKSERKKLCWNCEGSVSLDVEYCPFCGVSVVPAFLEGAEVGFAPPYSMHAEKDFSIPKSPFDLGGEDKNLENPEGQTRVESVDSAPAEDEFKKVALAVSLLLGGSVFFLFSIALGLFSRDGIFTLQWDATYWFVYTLLALPIFLFGWRSLMKLDL